MCRNLVLNKCYFKWLTLKIFKVKKCHINFRVHIEMLTLWIYALIGSTKLTQFSALCRNKCLMSVPESKLDDTITI